MNREDRKQASPMTKTEIDSTLNSSSIKTINEFFRELETHLMNDTKPSEYFISIQNITELQVYPFDMLFRLQSTKQSPQHHPEGSVWNHTLLVVDEAAKVKDKSKQPDIFMWAALLHDIGKPSTTRSRKGKITSYDHDKIGAELASEFLSIFMQDKAKINQICALIRYHMQILFVVKDLPFADVEGMRAHTDIHEVAMLGLCDRLGRSGSNRRLENENIRLFLKKAKHS